MHFVDNESIISEQQYGFRRKCSTMHNLLFFTNYVSHALDTNLDVHCVLIDFSKAFDHIDHHLLINKLHDHNFNKYYINIISSYLTGCVNYTYCNKQFSTAASMQSGVPQGSILSPLLFSIFINDLMDVINIQCVMYADDVKIFSTISRNNFTSETEDFQRNLNKVNNWSIVNKLPININKTNFIIFSNKLVEKDICYSNFNYTIGKQTLTRVYSITDLGVKVRSPFKLFGTLEICY